MTTRARLLLRAAMVLSLAATAVVVGGDTLRPRAARAADDGGDERELRLIETYRGMLAEDPDQEYPFRRLLEVSHAVGGLVGLVRAYEEEVKAKPGSYSAWMVLGHLYRAAEDEAHAAAAYDAAQKLKPAAPGPALARAQLYRRLRRWDQAFAAYDEAVGKLKERDRLQEVLREAAEAAVEADQVERANHYFDRLVQTEPGNVFLRMQWAATLGKLGRNAEALAAWRDLEERAKGQEKHLVIIWKEIGDLQMTMGDLAEAEKTWRRALDKTPVGHWERQTFLDGLIAVYRRQDRLRELVAELEPEMDRQYETLITVARLYEELADDAKALSLYRKALGKRPSDLQARLSEIRLLERFGTADELVEAYRALIRAAPGEPRHELRLAELLFYHGRAAEGYALIDQISRKYPNDPGVHQRVIDLWMRHGDRTTKKRVEGEYKTLMRLEPGEESHVISLGEYYWSLDDQARARSTWAHLLKMGKSPGEGHFLLAEVLADHDLTAEATAEYQEAIRLEPKNPRFAKAYASLLEKQKQPAKALEAWRTVLESAAGTRGGSAVREARRHIIDLWDASGTLDKEIAALEARFAATPPDVAAGHFLAAAYDRTRRLADAERVLERLRAIDADDIEALLGLEQVYTRQNQLRKAIAVLEDLARSNSSGALDYLHRAADLALSLGDEPLALRFARQVVEMNPADARAHLRVGDLYARMGFRNEAADAWRQALVLDPRNDGVRFKLAGLYRDIGQPIREEQVLAEIVREAREPTDALRAGRRLLQLGVAEGRLEQIEDVLRPLVESGNARSIYLKLLVDAYAFMCQSLVYDPRPAAEREQALQLVGERALKPLLDALADNDVAVRSRALDVLELTHPAGASPILARLTQETDMLAQIQAAATLGKIGTESAVAALARMAMSAKKPLPRVAEWALGLVSSEAAATVLAERARRASPGDRVLLTAALAKGADPSAYTALAELAGDHTPDVRVAAIWGLGRLRRPDAIELLAQRARTGTEREARAAVWALGRIATPEAREAAVRTLFADERVPADAVWDALADDGSPIGDPWAEASWDALLDRDRGLVSQPGPSLYQLGTPPPGPPIALVARSREAVAARVRTMLAVPGDPHIADLLAAAVAPTDGLSLGPPEGPPAVLAEDARATTAIFAAERRSLVQLARGEGTDAAAGLALEVLARLATGETGSAGDREQVIELALTALGPGGQPATQRGALDALARLTAPGDARVAEVLVGASFEGDGAAAVAARVRLAALLGRAAGGTTPQALVDLAHDAFAPVRAAATRALTGRADDVAVAALVELAHDDDAGVAVAAIAGLGEARTASAREALVSLATTAPPRVARAARAIVGDPPREPLGTP